MSARNAFAFVALWISLTIFLIVLDRHAPVEKEQAAEPKKLLQLNGAKITALELRADGRYLRCERNYEKWRVVEPAGASAPTDLITTIVKAVIEGDVAEIVSHDPDRAAEFGLEKPHATISIAADGSPPVKILLGSRNPAQTAVYAQREHASEIVLIGLNLDYYIDLALGGAAS